MNARAAAPRAAPPAPLRIPIMVPGADVAVRLHELHKRFPVRRPWRELLLHPRDNRQLEVLRGVSCEVRRGELFGILGPNGAGKTTLFKILSTLVLPDSGSVTVAGLDVVRDAARIRRTLAPVITDERSLNWRLSARENLRFYGALHGLRGPELQGRIGELLQVVELADSEEKAVGSFSSGMKQRLLIARALISRPSILLLDEPTRSLDPISARRFRTFLRRELIEKQGCTLLLATHTAEEAFELCDRVTVLERGRVLASGAPRELVTNVADSRYEVFTRQPDHPAFARLVAEGLAMRTASRTADSQGLARVDVDVADGTEAADVNRFLVLQGVPISQFSRTALSLADLIERIQQRAEEERNV